jgi:hypothetical protein
MIARGLALRLRRHEASLRYLRGPPPQSATRLVPARCWFSTSAFHPSQTCGSGESADLPACAIERAAHAKLYCVCTSWDCASYLGQGEASWTSSAYFLLSTA